MGPQGFGNIFVGADQVSAEKDQQYQSAARYYLDQVENIAKREETNS
jgi:hypothetical protein